MIHNRVDTVLSYLIMTKETNEIRQILSYPVYPLVTMHAVCFYSFHSLYFRKAWARNKFIQQLLYVEKDAIVVLLLSNNTQSRNF